MLRAFSKGGAGSSVPRPQFYWKIPPCVTSVRVAAIQAGGAGRAHHAGTVVWAAVPVLRDVAVGCGPRSAAVGAGDVPCLCGPPHVPVLVRASTVKVDLEVAIFDELEADRSHRARAAHGCRR